MVKRLRTMHDEDLPKGFTCKCGIESRFPMYVYAHWDWEIHYKCDCGREYNVLRGIAREIPKRG